VVYLAGHNGRLQHAEGIRFMYETLQFAFRNLLGHVKVACILSLPFHVWATNIKLLLFQLLEAVRHGKLLPLEATVR
jgi:hypothetical protein